MEGNAVSSVQHWPVHMDLHVLAPSIYSSRGALTRCTTGGGSLHSDTFMCGHSCVRDRREEGSSATGEHGPVTVCAYHLEACMHACEGSLLAS